VLAGDVVEEVSRLKQLPDGDIVVYASNRLGSTIIENGLADEVRIVVFPVVVGTGARLLAGVGTSKAMRLAGPNRSVTAS
jgi:dihydrofolate reductase